MLFRLGAGCSLVRAIDKSDQMRAKNIACKHWLIAFLALVILGLQVACLDQVAPPTPVSLPPRDLAFATIIPFHQNDSYVKLRIKDDVMQNFRGVFLRVENVSQETLVFPYDWGIKTYLWSSNSAQWTELQNRATYSPSSDITMASSALPETAFVDPILPQDETYPLTVRVVIHGAVVRNSSMVEQFSTYLDISLDAEK